MLSGKNIVVGVTGGIAAYKSAELISRLKKLNATVHVIMTQNACRFITPLTLQTLSQNTVISDMFKEPITWEIEHISLAEKADLFIVLPCTANVIGKVGNGMADDMLSTTIMATRAPVLFACAMNTNMYENQIVQHNISRLKKVGHLFVEPESGKLACGKEGVGRLAEIDDVVEKAVRMLLYKQDLTGKTVLITAGPTKEYIDPVRFISNGSSGKMGYALAKVALNRGARVILVSGPVKLKKPVGAEIVEVTTAQEMYDEVVKRFECADIIVKAAAVSDYKPMNISNNKIKKTSETLTIELQKTPDILKHIGLRKGNRTVVGFSMETEKLEQYAMVKLKEKNLDMIVANNINEQGAGFGKDTNVVKIINKYGETKDLPLMTKDQVSDVIFNEILKMEKLNE